VCRRDLADVLLPGGRRQGSRRPARPAEQSDPDLPRPRETERSREQAEAGHAGRKTPTGMGMHTYVRIGAWRGLADVEFLEGEVDPAAKQL
jgi:hypothetical protein